MKSYPDSTNLGLKRWESSPVPYQTKWVKVEEEEEEKEGNEFSVT